MNLTNSLIERTDMVLYTLSNGVAPLITLLVWLSFTPPGTTSVFPRNELIWYFILAMFVKLFTSAWSGVFLASRIRRGAISPNLLQPVPLMFHYIGNNIAEKIVKLLIFLPLLTLLVIIFRLPILELKFLQAITVLISLILAASIYFLIDICIGLTAFWLDETSGIGDLYGLLSVLFSGMLIPLSALPVAIRNISFYLPFRFTFSLPIEIALGQLNNFNLYLSLSIQLFWLVIVWCLYSFFWSRGSKVYSASGA